MGQHTSITSPEEVMQWVARQTDEFFHNEVIPALKDRYNDYVVDGEAGYNFPWYMPLI